jgi:hypothetical protein
MKRSAVPLSGSSREASARESFLKFLDGFSAPTEGMSRAEEIEWLRWAIADLEARLFAARNPSEIEPTDKDLQTAEDYLAKLGEPLIPSAACPCGSGAILADTEDWVVPLCRNCWDACGQPFKEPQWAKFSFVTRMVVLETAIPQMRREERAWFRTVLNQFDGIIDASTAVGQERAAIVAYLRSAAEQNPECSGARFAAALGDAIDRLAHVAPAAATKDVH